MSIATKETGVPFKAEMVRAIRAGRKRQTRRIVKPQPFWCHGLQPMWGTSPDGVAFGDPYLWREVGPDYPDSSKDDRRPPYGVPGDLLVVKESLRRAADGTAMYAADGSPVLCADGRPLPWRWLRSVLPSIHMPRACARTFLTLTEVRAQQLHNVSLADARLEGLPDDGPDGYSPERDLLWYRNLWESINGPGSWARNEWVWAYTFDPRLEGGL